MRLGNIIREPRSQSEDFSREKLDRACGEDSPQDARLARVLNKLRRFKVSAKNALTLIVLLLIKSTRKCGKNSRLFVA